MVSSIDAVQLQQLLRHRAADGLAGVEVGPLLGRGSYGRVYKGKHMLNDALPLLRHLTCSSELPAPNHGRG